MIQIKPEYKHLSSCPYCAFPLLPGDFIWQGIHFCIKSQCFKCKIDFIEDIPVGHGEHYKYIIDITNNNLLGPALGNKWLGLPLKRSIHNPNPRLIKFDIEVLHRTDRIIILNCIDFLYGHALLKLLNAQKHIDNNREYGLVLLIQPFLRWLVPDGVAEIWTVDIPLKEAQDFYPSLGEQINAQLERFSTVQISNATAHPANFDITRFTRVNKHDFSNPFFRITFIWREDRPWLKNNILRRAIKHIEPLKYLLYLQNYKVVNIFTELKKHFPNASFCVTGAGNYTSFPYWIDDRRVKRHTPELESELCKIYSESRMIIGVHGSNMLLPSAHAGITIDLVPDDRWHNLTQDILYQVPDGESADDRLTAWRHQYLPLDTSIRSITISMKSLLEAYPIVRNLFNTTE